MNDSPNFLPSKKLAPILLFVIGLLAGVALIGASVSLTSNIDGNTAAVVASPFLYSFSSTGILGEAGSMKETTSPYWWLNSGGYLTLKEGRGATAQGDLGLLDPWRVIYAVANPQDTDGGRHPQNLFRLVSRSAWVNMREEASFYIVRDNFSASPNQNASNGLLLMSRYQDDGQTLYYAGIRVDGTAVIKKKYKGTYYTMAQEKVFPGTYSSASLDKNLLPHEEWVSLRSDTVTNEGGTVTVSLYMKRAGESTWKLLLKATDTGKNFGATPITTAGFGGIRTDFMDVKFDNIKLENI